MLIHLGEKDGKYIDALRERFPEHEFSIDDFTCSAEDMPSLDQTAEFYSVVNELKRLQGGL